MADRRRQLGWPGFANARTLAGMPTRQGEIAPRSLYRSDQPDAHRNRVEQILREEGISTVLDLRSGHETQRCPSILAGHAAYVPSALVDPRMDHLRDPSSERSLLDLYRGSVNRNGRTIAAGIRRIIDAAPGGVLVHCAVGKDRTGILVGIVLEALGTPREMIIEDYAMTERADLAVVFARELAAIEDPTRRTRLASRQHASPDTMSGLLHHLDERHGGAVAYLRAHGLSESDLKGLETRLSPG